MPDDAPPVPLDELLAHREWVRRVAWALTRDAHDADDVEQATWLAAVRAPPTHRTSLKGWLGTTIRRAAGRLRQVRTRRDALGATLASERRASDAAEDVAELTARADLHRRVVEAVVALDEPVRGTLLLRFFEGLPVAEVAARTGVPLETARARLRRGIERLRERFRKSDGGLAGLALLAAPTPRGGGEGAPVAGSAAAASAGGLVMGAKTWAAVAIVALALGGWWWTTRASDATPGAVPPPAAPDADSPAARPPSGPNALRARPRAAPPDSAPAVAADAAPLLPPPGPTDAKSRLEATRMTLRWEGAALEPLLATIVAESGVEIVLPKAAVQHLANVEIYLTLEDVSALTALRTISKVSGTVADIQQDRVVVRPQGAAPANDGELVRVRRLEDLPHATVTFHVVDAAGAAVAGAAVIPESRTPFGTTDAAGSLTVRRPLPFPWTLARIAGRIDAPATRVAADAAAPVDVTLTIGGVAGHVRGTLRTDDGRAVARHWIHVAAVETGQRRTLASHALQTDDAGAFDDASCPPGRLVLTASAEGCAYTEHEFDAAAGGDVRVDVVLAREAVCTGLVRGVSGDPAPSVRVTASIPTRPGVATAFTDPTGRYRLVGLPAGRISLEAIDLRTRAAARTEIDIGAGETRTWDTQLESAPK